MDIFSDTYDTRNECKFMRSIRDNDIQFVKRNMDKFDHSRTNILGENSLLIAAKLNRVEMIKLLIKTNRYDLLHRDNNYMDLFYYVLKFMMIDVYFDNIDVFFKESTTALPIFLNILKDDVRTKTVFRLIHKNNYDIIKIIVIEKLYIGNEDNIINYILHNDNTELMDILEENDFTFGRHIIIVASGSNKEKVVKKLIEFNTYLNYNISGETPLIVASRNGHVNIVKILIEAGANLNINFNNLYDTALMEASRNGYADIVKMLIRAGADVNLKNRGGETALSLSSNTEIGEMLIRAGAKREECVIC